MTTSLRPPATAAPGVVLKRAAMSLLLPGAGHLHAGQRLVGAVLLTLFVCGTAAAAVHLLRGLQLFEAPLGAFAFGALLRGLAVLWAFAALDIYLRGIGAGEHGRREKTLANFLLPGAGYLLAKSWMRAGSSLLVLVVVVYVARTPNRYLDLIFIGFQLVTAFGVYQQLATAHLEATREAPQGPPPEHLPAAQIQLLVQLMAAVVLLGWVVMTRMTDIDKLRIGDKDVSVRRRAGGLQVGLAKHQLSFTLPGSGWKAGDRGGGAGFFRARHELGASFLIGVQPVLPFVRPERYLLSMQRQLSASGYSLAAQQSLTVAGLAAHQLRLTRKISGMELDRWALVLPRGEVAYVMLLSCGRTICKRLLPAFEKARDSLRVGAAAAQ